MNFRLITAAAATVAFFFAMGAARAADEKGDDCHKCEQFKLALLHIPLAVEASEIGIAALHADDGHAFYRSAADLAALRQRMATDMGVPPECVSQMKTQSWFQVTARGNISDAFNNQVTLNSQSATDITNSYANIMNNFSKTCPAAGAKNAPAWCNGNNSSFANFSLFLQQSPSAISAAVSNAGTANSIYLAQKYNAWLTAPNDAGAAAVWRSMRGLSNDAKFDFAAMMLAQADNAYQYDRTNMSNPASNGVVSYSAMRAAMLSNAENGYLYNQPANAAVAGICRDHHSMAAEALREMGEPNSYVMSWTEADGAHHVIVLAQANGEDLRIRTDDYGNQYMTIGREGSVALWRGQHDDTAFYRIAVPSGPIVQSIATQSTITLSEAAGFDPQKSFDPLIKPQGNLLAGNVSTDDNGHFQLRAFAATDGNQARYLGVASTASYGATDRAPTDSAQSGKVGIAIGTRITPPDNFPSLSWQTQDANTQFVYLQAEHDMRSASIPINKSQDTQLRFEGNATAVGQASYTKSDNSDNGSLNVDGDLRVTAGARLSHNMNGARNDGSPNDPFAWQVYAGAQVSPIGLANIQNNQVLQVPLPYLNNAIISAEGSTATGLPGEPRLFAAGTLVFDYFGTRGKGEVGLATDKWSATLGFRGRLSESTPIFDEGSIREVDTDVVYKLLPNLRFGVNGYHVLDTDPSLAPIWGMGGNITFTQ